jgi:APA family basic amino acid/polyamine antiporter
MAASAIFLIFVLDRFIPGVANSTPFFAIPLPYVPLTLSRHTLLAIIAVWLFALVHIRGVGPGRVVMNVLATLKVTALLVFIALGFTIGTGASTNLQQVAGPVSATNWLLALVPVMFTYSGWNAAAYMAEEIRDPGRNVPLALLAGTIGVIIIYGLLNTLYLYAMPVGELAAVKGSVFDLIGERVLGARAGDVLGLVAIVGVAAGLNAWTFAGPRIYYAMARDGVFFASAGWVHPRWRTPAVAILFQGLFSVAYVWRRAAFDAEALDSLLDATVIADWTFFALCGLALFVLRRRRPEAPRPYRAFGYPWLPGLFVLCSIGIVVNSLFNADRAAALGYAVLLGAGVCLYALWSRGARPAA